MSYLSVFVQNVAERRGRGARSGGGLRAGAGRRLRRASPPAPRRSRRSRSGAAREPFYRVVQAGFRQRRKQIHNGLSRELPVDRERRRRTALAACGVDPERRPQTLTLDEWACLASRLGRLLVSTPLRLEAPAKLNLTLRVVGRRDGRLPPPREPTSSCSSSPIGCCCCRAAAACASSGEAADRAARSTRPTSPGAAWWRGSRAEPELACLALEKRIPVAAGLGGGSSDAAAAWRLGRAWRGAARGRAGEDDWRRWRAIGADVPFFAACRAAAARDGDRRAHRADRAAGRATSCWRIPPFGAVDRRRLRRAAARRVGQRVENDLLAPALPPAPGARRRASGSWPERAAAAAHRLGPTVFALTDDPERAAAIAGRLARGRASVRPSPARATQPASIERHRPRRNDMADARGDQHRCARRRRPAPTARRSAPASSSSPPGQLGIDPATGEFAAADVAGQAERALANLRGHPRGRRQRAWIGS